MRTQKNLGHRSPDIYVPICQAQYNPGSQTAAYIGAGLVWDDVYAVLDPPGVNILGGQTTRVGVAVFTLGFGG
jgi:hypothetical protein